MEGPPLTVILSPHYDDAVISLGGFLAQSSEETIVVTVFGGKPATSRPASGWALDAGFRTSDEENSARIRENERALERLRAKIHNLDYLDNPYRDGSGDVALPGSIARDVGALLKAHESRAVNLYGPAALPRVGRRAAHPDHRIVHEAFLLLVRQRLPNVRSLVYEDLPYATRSEADAGGFKELLERTAGISLKARVWPLTDRLLGEKSAAIAEYPSQLRAAKKVGQDFQDAAQRFARDRGSNPWMPCAACEVVYEVLEPEASAKTTSASADANDGSPVPPVTAVIVTYRSSGVVGAALAALKNCCDAGFLRCVVVDNASPDATADLVAREHPWVTLIRSPQNLGYGRGCNLGLEQVQTPYVIAMNPDVVVEKESVERLLRFMERHPKAGMAAPATLCGGSEYQHVGGMPTPWSIVTGGSDPMPLLPDAPPFSTDWLCGAFMLMRTGALREVRGFDPRFFLYFEETDLCLRLRKAGYELWAVGEAKAIHAGGASVRRVDPTLQPGQNLAVHFFASRYYYLTKHHGRVAAVATETAELLVKGLRDLLRAVLGKRPQREFRTRLQAPMFTVPPDVGLGP